MIQELYEIYERNFPYIFRAKENVLRILRNEGNTVIEHRDERNSLVGVSVINQNTILLLCVDTKYRNRGIGAKLLERSEDVVKSNGYNRIVIGAGFDYITPGVPTSRRYVEAENEDLCKGIDEAASSFFTKRGYVHSWNCNCFDMRLLLSQFEKNAHSVGDIIDGITYRWAELSDLDEICVCTENAWQEFTVFYQYEKLYAFNNASRVLIAVLDGEVVGALIAGPEEGDGHFGSIGCVVVKREHQGKHIAVNLVTIGTRYLKEVGVEEAYLSYTYTGLDHVYGYAGYKISVYYMMAVKGL